MSLVNKNNKRTKIRGSIVKNIMYKQCYKCAKCNFILSPANQVDHIIPYSITGDDSEDNLQVLCANCHALKSFEENYRISKYKKIRENYKICDKNVDVCWFCLENYNKKEEGHSCEKIMKNIEEFIRENETYNMLNKRKRTDDFVNICNKFKNISIEQPTLTTYLSDILEIVISQEHIKCKNKIYKYNAFTVTAETIGNIILKSLDSKDKNRYSEVLIKIDIDLDPEEYDFEKGVQTSTDHLIEYLPEYIPDEIIKDGTLIINVE